MNWNKDDIEQVDSDEKGFIPSTPDELDEVQQHEEDAELEASPGPVELEGGEIEVVDSAPASVSRIAKAVQVTAGVVSNILRVPVDENDVPVAFEVPYGTELVVVDEDAVVEVGYVQIDDEFVNPNE